MTDAFTIRLDDDTLAALDKLAEATERSRNWLVTRAVQDYIALNDWQVGRIESGLRAASAGEFATDAEVERVRMKFADRG